jgi:hypothetical protein
MSIYAGKIRQIAPNQDPRHVEAWLKLGNPPLDRLTDQQFEREVLIAVDAMQHSRRGSELAEMLGREG